MVVTYLWGVPLLVNSDGSIVVVLVARRVSFSSSMLISSGDLSLGKAGVRGLARAGPPPSVIIIGMGKGNYLFRFRVELIDRKIKSSQNEQSIPLFLEGRQFLEEAGLAFGLVCPQLALAACLQVRFSSQSLRTTLNPTGRLVA